MIASHPAGDQPTAHPTVVDPASPDDSLGGPLADVLAHLDEIHGWAARAADALREALHVSVHDLPPTISAELTPDLVMETNRLRHLRDRLRSHAAVMRALLGEVGA